MAEYSLRLPLSEADARMLRAGDTVLLSGDMYTGRDAAHKRLIALLDEGKPLPMDLQGQVIYYVGPAPASPGHAVGAAGPTSSYRMDPYTPALLRLGLRGMIGKGRRNEEVRRAMQACDAVYFGAVGGAAALIARSIRKSEVIAYDDLGCESVKRFTIRDFPLFVAIDTLGNSIFKK